jgi:hypothetical protein
MIPLLLAFLYAILFPTAILALELSLKDPPASVNVEESTDFKVDLACSSCSDSYLRAVFFKDGNNYFGLTQNKAGEYIGVSAEKAEYFLITGDEIPAGSWSGVLKVRIDTDSKYYIGPGQYNFKVIRYTKSGSKSGETDSVALNLSGPVPTATPIPPTIVPTPIIPTSTPKPKPTLAPPPKSTHPTPALQPTVSLPASVPESTARVLDIEESSPEAIVLAATTTDFPSVSALKTKSLLWPVVCWLVGGVLILASIYLFFA